MTAPDASTPVRSEDPGLEAEWVNGESVRSEAGIECNCACTKAEHMRQIITVRASAVRQRFRQYSRAPLRHPQVPHFRASAFPAARLGRSTDRDEPGNHGLQPETHDQRARGRKTDRYAANLNHKGQKLRSPGSRKRAQRPERTPNSTSGIQFRNSLASPGESR